MLYKLNKYALWKRYKSYLHNLFTNIMISFCKTGGWLSAKHTTLKTRYYIAF